MSGTMGRIFGGLFSGRSQEPKPTTPALPSPVEPTVQLGHKCLTRDEAAERYGPISDGVWPNQARWMIYIPLPEEISAVLRSDGKPVTRIYCNLDISVALKQALQNVVDRGCAHELKTYDGCLAIRDVRGSPGHLSAHAYGLAIDLNADLNPLGAESNWSTKLVECFTDCGFDWGGNFSGRLDSMHFSRCWEHK